ncbi:ribose-5-phosphate isomerase RpiA [Candidatus Bipolaricaulota bacterium]|nr:ribose-5-phosphate isomerase RpiA [Candidatus Bipolaricaulota bacterium]
MDFSKSEIVKLKKQAAETAVEWLLKKYDASANIYIGAGSGSTVAYGFPRLTEFANLTAVPTSNETRDKLEALDIPTEGLEGHDELLFDIDGADEVDPNLNLIKGGGGCHNREKQVANRSKLLVITVDERKLVDYLGQSFPLPVEVVPEARDGLIDRLGDYGEAKIRADDSGLFSTDGGNLIVDVRLQRRYDEDTLKLLEEELNDIDGVVENGLFVHRKADVVFVGAEDGVRMIKHEKTQE